ncbi:MAG TPA: hypothetical protein VIQ30_04870 [Pseudonocardia sp.]
MADSTARDRAAKVVLGALMGYHDDEAIAIVDALCASPGVLRALAGEAEPDEMEEHFLDANERMGEALTRIGMTAGLPRPTAQHHWGADQIVRRIEQLREDIAMYERWAELSPARVVECSCGLRHSVRIADHEIGEAVPAGDSAPTEDLRPTREMDDDAADRVISWSLFGTTDTDLVPDDSDLPVGELRRLVREVAVPSLRSHGLLRAGGSAPHQGATTDVTALSAVLAQTEHDASCQCGYTPQAPSDRHRAMAEAAVRALLGAGETTEETHG